MDQMTCSFALTLKLGQGAMLDVLWNFTAWEHVIAETSYQVKNILIFPFYTENKQPKSKLRIIQNIKFIENKSCDGLQMIFLFEPFSIPLGSKTLETKKTCLD